MIRSGTIYAFQMLGITLGQKAQNSVNNRHEDVNPSVSDGIESVNTWSLLWQVTHDWTREFYAVIGVSSYSFKSDEI